MQSKTKKMRATKLMGPMDLSIETLPIPEITEGSVLLGISAVGVCPSGLKMLKDPSRIDEVFWDIPGFPGHETAAEVVEVGPGVEGLVPGDHVVPTGPPACGQCHFCRRGQLRFCKEKDFSKIENMSFADYMLCDAASLLPIAEGLGDEEACFAEPLACCVASVEKCSVRAGDTVIVVGAGTMGLLHVQILRSLGARPIVIEPNKNRRTFALEMGANLSLHPDPRAKDQIKEMTHGRGADAVIVTVGAAEAIQSAFDLVGPGGTLMFFAGTWPPTSVNLDPNLIHYQQMNVTGTVGTTAYDFERALALMAHGSVDVKPLISGRYPLQEIIQAHRASEELSTYKILVKP
jgi:L-iditol 2-dehydrogenase